MPCERSMLMRSAATPRRQRLVPTMSLTSCDAFSSAKIGGSASIRRVAEGNRSVVAVLVELLIQQQAAQAEQAAVAQADLEKET